VLAGKIGSDIAAAVMVGHDGHRGVLYYLSVAPRHQGKGLGRVIHDAAVAWLLAQGVWKINLLVRGDNEKVHGFYKALGYGENDAKSFGKQIAT
jgi:GNAT superfamily N-acetyltransferase